jgi:hypothetical protein
MTTFTGSWRLRYADIPHLAKNTAAHGRSHIGDAVAYVRKGSATISVERFVGERRHYRMSTRPS